MFSPGTRLRASIAHLSRYSFVPCRLWRTVFNGRRLSRRFDQGIQEWSKVSGPVGETVYWLELAGNRPAYRLP